jgi:hypothetical protein
MVVRESKEKAEKRQANERKRKRMRILAKQTLYIITFTIVYAFLTRVAQWKAVLLAFSLSMTMTAITLFTT